MYINMIRATKANVQATEAFKALNRIRREFATKANNLKHIDHGLTVCGHIGFEKWSKQTNASALNVAIVKEIFEKESN